MMATGNQLGALPRDIPVRVLDGSPDAVLICDRAGIVRYWNTAAERVFGFPAAETLGASMNLIVPERLRPRHWAGWEAAMTTGVTRYAAGQLLAVPAVHKDGRQISIEFSIQLLADAGGRIAWVVAIIRDMTERFLREKELRAQSKAIQAQDTSGAPGQAARTGTETSMLTIPKALQTEHEEIHESLVNATRAPGRVGAAARELAAVLHPHFERENQIALPPLGLLAPFAAGQTPAGLEEALAMTDALRKELPRMLDEHARIRAATERLRLAAREEKAPVHEHLAETLAAHAQTEEEVLYPAAILLGDIIRERIATK